MLFFFEDIDHLILTMEGIAQEIFTLIHAEDPNCELLLAKAELLEALTDRLSDKFHPVFRPDDRRLRSHLGWMKTNLQKKQWRSSQGDASDFIRQDIPLLKKSIRGFFASRRYLAFPTSQVVRDTFPNVYKILDAAYADLFKSPPAQDYVAKVGYACRDALKQFAAAIYRPEFCPQGSPQPTEEQYKLRFRYFLRAHGKGETLEAFIEAQRAYLEAAITFANASGHNEQVSRDYVARILLHTYLIVETTWELGQY